ncbi:TPA: hypothetical protein ACKQCJ_000396 [Stenotrophomonas maltophilia]
MKTTLKAGTRKVLLIDVEAISRNADRGTGNCQPVVSVAEVDEKATVLSMTRGLQVEVKGTVDFEYSQHAFLFVIDRVPHRGAWVTDGEVVVDDGSDAAPVASELTPRIPNRPARRNASNTATEEAIA